MIMVHEIIYMDNSKLRIVDNESKELCNIKINNHYPVNPNTDQIKMHILNVYKKKIYGIIRIPLDPKLFVSSVYGQSMIKN